MPGARRCRRARWPDRERCGRVEERLVGGGCVLVRLLARARELQSGSGGAGMVQVWRKG